MDRVSTPSRHDWGRNLPFATHSRTPKKAEQEEYRPAGRQCSCVLPWTLVAILATALLVQSIRGK